MVELEEGIAQETASHWCTLSGLLFKSAFSYVLFGLEQCQESRYALLGISNSIMVAEITANRVLDHTNTPE
ncbi:hypothetical protein ABH909_003595 [Pseudomonas sp. BS3782 TE3695]|jgi:hypothetical protein